MRCFHEIPISYGEYVAYTITLTDLGGSYVILGLVSQQLSSRRSRFGISIAVQQGGNDRILEIA